MNKYTLIEIGVGLLLIAIAVISFFATRGKLTRKSLSLYIGQLAVWTVFGIFVFSGQLAVFYFVVIACIYIPSIVWILKLPKDDHVA